MAAHFDPNKRCFFDLNDGAAVPTKRDRQALVVNHVARKAMEESGSARMREAETGEAARAVRARVPRIVAAAPAAAAAGRACAFVRKYPPLSVVDVISTDTGACMEGLHVCFEDAEIHQLFRPEREEQYSDVAVRWTRNRKPVIQQQQQAMHGAPIAAVMMLIFEKTGKLTGEDARLLSRTNLGTLDSRMETIKRAGLTPKSTKLDSMDHLAELIKRNGSAIVSCNMGSGVTSVLVDEVTKDYVRIRDPYHGWEIEVTREAFEESFKKGSYAIQLDESNPAAAPAAAVLPAAAAAPMACVERGAAQPVVAAAAAPMACVERGAALVREYPPVSIVDTQVDGESVHGKGNSFEDADILQLFRPIRQEKYLGIPVHRTQNGKPVIQQQGTRGCTAAAAMMLIFEKTGKLTIDDVHYLTHTNLGDKDRMMAHIRKSGLTPKYTEVDSLDQLAGLISENGSAIVSCDSGIGGHVIVVDEVTKDHVRIRDPYHGWEVSVTPQAFQKAIGHCTYALQLDGSNPVGAPGAAAAKGRA